MSVRLMPQPIRSGLKKIPGLILAWRFLRFGLPNRIRRVRYASELKIIEGLPLFTPNSGGALPTLALLTLESAEHTVLFLARLASQAIALPPIEDLKVDSFGEDTSACTAAAALKSLFTEHHSDKSTVHDYHRFYGPLLRRPEQVRKVLEIGIGTNNEDVVSNMSRKGTPGASLRAFRDFLPHATIFGADIDSRVLFAEDRIKTFVVDQTKAESLETLGDSVGGDFDLIIDDGLHSPHANLAVLMFAMQRVKVGGAIVIEDIARAATPLWQLVGGLMPSEFDCRLFRTRNALVFIARKQLASHEQRS